MCDSQIDSTNHQQVESLFLKQSFPLAASEDARVKRCNSLEPTVEAIEKEKAGVLMTNLPASLKIGQEDLKECEHFRGGVRRFARARASDLRPLNSGER